MSSPVKAFPALNNFTAISVSGAEARTFLQGQVSNDLRKLTPQRAVLASSNSAQGRVQSILTLLDRGDTIVALVATSLANRVLAKLRSYVLRSKVILAESPELAIASVAATNARNLVDTLPSSAGDCVTRGPVSVMRWWSADERYLLLAPRTDLDADSDAVNDLHWRRAEIAAGIPQIYPETQEIFVAQMLNLDLLGGISFDKGCYTGQEIIARTQYRGTIKRRMMRFTANCAVPVPGTRVLTAGSHCGEVVDACVANGESSNSCELLAVVSVDRANEPLDLDGIAGSSLARAGLPYVIPQAAAA